MTDWQAPQAQLAEDLSERTVADVAIDVASGDFSLLIPFLLIYGSVEPLIAIPAALLASTVVPLARRGAELRVTLDGLVVAGPGFLQRQTRRIPWNAVQGITLTVATTGMVVELSDSRPTEAVPITRLLVRPDGFRALHHAVGLAEAHAGKAIVGRPSRRATTARAWLVGLSGAGIAAVYWAVVRGCASFDWMVLPFSLASRNVTHTLTAPFLLLAALSVSAVGLPHRILRLWDEAQAD